MPRSRQHEEGPTLARFLRENVSIEDQRDCPLDFFTRGRHPATVSDSGCPTAAAFSNPASLYPSPELSAYRRKTAA